MKIHSTRLIEKIKDLRRRGASIPEIVTATGIAKTTIWHHVHEISVPLSAQRAIRSNQGGSKKRKAAALIRAKNAVGELLHTKEREIVVIASMLYWAEGSKRELVFTNTDVNMVRIYLYFLRNILKVPETDLHLLIRIADPIHPHDVQRFWAKQAKMKREQVRINHNNVQNKTKGTYGICRVNVRKNSYYLKQMQCIIDAVKEKYAPIV